MASAAQRGKDEDEQIHSFEGLMAWMTPLDVKLLRLVASYGNSAYWAGACLVPNNEYEYKIWARKSTKAWRIIVKLLFRRSNGIKKLSR